MRSEWRFRHDELMSLPNMAVPNERPPGGTRMTGSFVARRVLDRFDKLLSRAKAGSVVLVAT